MTKQSRNLMLSSNPLLNNTFILYVLPGRDCRASLANDKRLACCHYRGENDKDSHMITTRKG
jgi:hypothetical protein